MKAKTVKKSSVIMAHLMMPQNANPTGIIHGGVVMRHIDEAAGVVAVRHSGSNAVTASIDRLDFHNPVFVGNLVTVKASINMVGRTSMEIGVRVETEDLISGRVRHTASAYLTYVAMDKAFRPKEVPPLKLATDEEKRRNKEALSRRKDRLEGKASEKECR
jgi:uncharacterized protein (TIGR00369 family)